MGDVHQLPRSEVLDQSAVDFARREDTVRGLRQLADLIDRRAEMPVPEDLDLYVHGATPEQFVGLVGLGLDWQPGTHQYQDPPEGMRLQLGAVTLIVVAPKDPHVTPVQASAAEALRTVQIRQVDDAS